MCAAGGGATAPRPPCFSPHWTLKRHARMRHARPFGHHTNRCPYDPGVSFRQGHHQPVPGGPGAGEHRALHARVCPAGRRGPHADELALVGLLLHTGVDGVPAPVGRRAGLCGGRRGCRTAGVWRGPPAAAMAASGGMGGGGRLCRGGQRHPGAVRPRHLARRHSQARDQRPGRLGQHSAGLRPAGRAGRFAQAAAWRDRRARTHRGRGLAGLCAVPPRPF